jgi:hypothetical protein
MNVLPAHDPTGAFARLKNLASNVPEEAWKNGVREGILGIFEDLGRLRNYYSNQDWDSFGIMSGLVAIGIAITYANLTRQVLRTEKDLTKVFENEEGSKTEACRAFRVAARLDPAEDIDVMESLDFLEDFLIKEAMKQSAMPQMYKSARNYSPP